MYNNSTDTLHSCPLPSDHVKVSVEFAIEGEEKSYIPVPIEGGNIFTIEDAVGTFVAWPKRLVSTMV